MILEVSISLGIIILSYWFYCYYYYYKYLKCVPSPRCWPIVGNVMQIRKLENNFDVVKTNMKELNSKTVRLHIGFRALLFTTDYNMIEFLLTSQTVIDKGLEYDFFLEWVGRGLFTSTSNRWRKQRKMITPTFHFQILEQFVDIFNSNTVILINKLRQEIGNPSVDVFPIFALYTLDIICEAAMGTSVNAQLEETSEFTKCVSTMGSVIYTRNVNPLYYSDWIYKLSGVHQKEKAALKVLHGYTEAVLQRKRQQLQQLQHKASAGNINETDDFGRRKKMIFIDMLLQSTIDGKPLSDEEIRDEVSTFMFAGHDTIATALSYAIFSLANNPDIQQKAFEEVYKIFGNDNKRACEIADINEMKYLDLVIKETMRMYPPVPIINRRALEDFSYSGITIPKMVTINIEIYGVHHDPDNYPEPENFDPERFAPENCDGKRPFCYIPFSAGPRNCIGQKFAYLEMKTTLSTILRNFELKPATPKHNLKLAAFTILKSLNGVKIAFHERKY